MGISRRTVLKAAGTSAGAAGAVPAGAHAAAAAVSHPAPAAGQRTADLTRGWRFALVNTTGEDAPQPDAGDPLWREVDLPHDWSIGLDPVRGPHTTDGSGYLPGGLGWYRTAFTLPRSAAGGNVSVEFDGVYMDALVYVNGTLAASHPYGYTGFAADLTGLAHTDGRTPNELAVRVRNRIPSSRWYSGSGIYRDVRLVVTDPVHIVRHGVAVTTPDLEREYASGSAAVHVAVTAAGDGSGAGAVVHAAVKDASGRTVTEGSAPASLTGGAGDTGTTGLDLRVREPVLWSVDRPYTYTVTTRLTVGGRTRDTVTTRFGFRWFAFDPDRGFSLNGTPAKLKGVNLHHDLGALGAAFHRDAARRQLLLMRSMGVNALRTAHNPPAPQVVELCDELGILMVIEAFDCWRTPKNPYDYGRFFDAHGEADITEMVRAARNSPAVVMWSIGNEVPDSTSPAGVPMARRLIDTVRAADPTRPVVMGSDKYRRVPADGSPQDLILRMLDGIGLNYNTAASVDALHAKYPGAFFFESESSSSTSARGEYDSPDQLNTGENHTPGRRGCSSYDNNLASWTMSGEYGLKKDRDREFFAGQFLWSGIDYLGEPTPFYDVFPVRASFFGAADTAGFPKDLYHLFRSQWTAEPMVHLVPMDWTGHRPGEEVEVWAYTNADTVELFLDGASLGTRAFDRKTTVHGTPYLETTEATGDDKTVTAGPYPGSYTSPNGSAGRLRLAWTVPFAPGRLVAVARRGGVEVARDEVRTAGEPAAVRLTADRASFAADGRSLAFVTAEVVDAHGVTVPYADHAITFRVAGGVLAGLDSGQQESAENHRSPSRAAYHGKVLAVVRAGRGAGPVTVTATARGLRSGTARIRTTGGTGAHRDAPALPAQAADEAPAGPRADAGFSGSPATVPAAMLDGDPATAWSNHYRKEATALLPEVSRCHAREWVSVTWPHRRRPGTVRVRFLQDAAHALPAAIAVRYWNGRALVPVRNLRVTWPTAPEEPVVLTFAPVPTTRVELTLTSRRPGTAEGFLGIGELSFDV